MMLVQFPGNAWIFLVVSKISECHVFPAGGG